MSTNWASHGLLDDFVRPYRDQIRRVLGLQAGGYTGQPDQVVQIAPGGRPQTAYGCEVFDAEAATDVFYGYFQTDRVPDACPLRRLDFSAYEK